MHRRALFAALLVLQGCAAAQPVRQAPPIPSGPTEWNRQLDTFWDRQREKEAADRFWNAPREARRALTRDQIERWEYQRWRRRGWPTYPF